MKVIKSIVIAFSLYSRIPMPHFDWEEDEYKLAITFLPLVGAVIGALSFLAFHLCIRFNIPLIATIAVMTLLPLVITGGFHVDGFMDVQDARNSFQSKERRLEIMKDPHIGAFAVISLAVYGIFWLFAMDIFLESTVAMENTNPMILYCCSFYIVRAFCSLSCVEFEKARKDGMLNRETAGNESVNKAIIYFFIMAGLIACMLADVVAAGLLVIGILCFSYYYKFSTKKLFGGVTGDTAGFFVTVGELVNLLILAAYSLVLYRSF